MSSSKILISGLIVHAVIGVHAFEQAIQQPLTLNIAFTIDADRAAKDDALTDTIDYADVNAAVLSFVNANPCRLVETLVERLAAHLRKTFQVRQLTISATKFPKDLPNVGSVTVTLTDD